jgi:hypothetical protein
MTRRQRKPYTNKYREVTNDWYGDSSCAVTSSAVWNLESFRCLIFIAQGVHCINL